MTWARLRSARLAEIRQWRHAPTAHALTRPFLLAPAGRLGLAVASPMQRRWRSDLGPVPQCCLVLLPIWHAGVASRARDLYGSAFESWRAGGGTLGRLLNGSRSASTLNCHALIDAISEHVRFINDFITTWAEFPSLLIHCGNSSGANNFLNWLPVRSIEDGRHRRGARCKNQDGCNVQEAHFVDSFQIDAGCRVKSGENNMQCSHNQYSAAKNTKG